MTLLRLSLLFSLLTACQAQPDPAAPRKTAPTAPPHWTGYYGGRQSFSLLALRTADEWDAFWRQVQRPKPQSLDTAREMGVAVFLGQRNTGGYGVEILQVKAEGGKLVVEYRETTPSPDMMVTQALTTPWTVVVVPRSDLPLESRKTAAAAQRQRR